MRDKLFHSALVFLVFTFLGFSVIIKTMYTLGIETSCDETSVALLKGETEISEQIILSQTDLHKDFGGVIPELASRKHTETLPKITELLLKKTGIKPEDINLISVAKGPGLAGALLVGLSYAKSLAYSIKKPMIGVNHIEAHLYANFMEYPGLVPPCVGLIVSGGHTTLVEIKDIGEYKILGQTLDDAAGEAFDKVAKLLRLGYPGGPIIDKISQQADPRAIRFPLAKTRKNNLDFSFSGLKTAVVYYVHPDKKFHNLRQRMSSGTKQEKTNIKNINKILPNGINNLVAGFQEAVVNQLIKKTVCAMKKTNHKTLLLGGGVSRNKRLRKRFSEEAKKNRWSLHIPSPAMCTDNAAMIAGLGLARYKKYGPSPTDIDINPRLGWEY